VNIVPELNISDNREAVLADIDDNIMTNNPMEFRIWTGQQPRKRAGTGTG